MSERVEAQAKTSLTPTTATTPATPQFQQRSFSVEPVATEQVGEQPDLQTQLDKATRFGHNFAQVKVYADLPQVIQPKLVIGPPGDKYEQEADQVAARVMAMPNPVSQPSMQRQLSEESKSPLAASILRTAQRQEPQLPIHRKSLLQRSIQSAASHGASSEIETQLSRSKGGGSPLPNQVRSFMEPRFGADFSQVRVHTGGEAVQMNRELGAQAFAHGSDIYFGAGKSPGNNELTAHELTHVVQQTGGVQTKLTLDQTDVQRKCSVCEQEEETVQRSLNVSAVSDSGIQRWSLFGDDEEEAEAESSSSGGILDWAAEQGGAAVDTVTEAGSDAYDWAEEKGSAAVDTVTEAGSDAYDWAEEKGSAAVDTVTQAGSDAYDWATETGSAAVDTVTQAGSDAYDWAKEKGSAAVDTVTQAGSDAYDWAKEKGEQYSSEFLEKKKASLMAQIGQALEKVAGQDFVYLSGEQIATLNSHLATLSQETQGSVSLPGIASQTDSTDSTAPPGTQPIAASTVATLLQNLQASLSTPFMSPPVSDMSDSDNSETVQGQIQRAAVLAPLAPLALAPIIFQALIIIGIIVIIILAAQIIKDAVKEKEEEKAREEELLRKIAECIAIHTAYKALGNCSSCKATDTPTERAAKVACLTAVIAGRRSYLKEKCDYVLPGSITRGSADAERGHNIQVAQLETMLLKCSTLPTA